MSCGALVHNLKGPNRMATDIPNPPSPMNKTLNAKFRQLKRELNRLSAHVVGTNPHLDAASNLTSRYQLEKDLPL